MMKTIRESPLTSYEAWRAFSTGECGLDLGPNYCRERIGALRDESDPATKSFLDCYGPAYRDRVVAWLERAASEPSR